MDLNGLRLEPIRRISRDEMLPARQTALVIIDMIRRFCDPVWCARGDIERERWIANELESVIPNTERLLHGLRERGVFVVHVVHAKWSKEAREVVPYLRGRDYDLFDTHDMSVIDALAPIPGEILMRKVAGSSFRGTGLGYLLRNAGIENVLLCGQQGDACVLYTLLDSRDLGFNNYWLEDCIYYSTPLYKELYTCLVPKRWAKLATSTDALSACRGL